MMSQPEVVKYKLSIVCNDAAIQKNFPELAEQALAAIQEIDRKIVSSSKKKVKKSSSPKGEGDKQLDDTSTNKHQSTRDRVQRPILSL